jgi:hypothetical protein
MTIVESLGVDLVARPVAMPRGARDRSTLPVGAQ